MKLEPRFCIYHGNCADGFGAAWAMYHAHPDTAFYPGNYKNPPPLEQCRDRDVYLVDFSYKLPQLEELIAVAASVTILDHHKTARDDIQPLLDDERVAGIFDMEKSGAMLTWEWFHEDKLPPLLIEHIQDRDLWRFHLPNTREIQAAVFSYPYDFEVWDELMKADLSLLARDGAVIERKHFKDIDELIKVSRRLVKIAGYMVPVANLPHTMASDAGHMMAQGHPFAACYMDDETGRTFSLRSTDEGIDVSQVAKEYGGGGGHKHAAGFHIPWDKVWEMEQ